MEDSAEGGSHSKPQAFQSGGGGGLDSTSATTTPTSGYLNHGVYGTERILSRPVVELMTTNRHTPDQAAALQAWAPDVVHLVHVQGQTGGWGFGMTVCTYRGDCAPIGQFG
ncbi:hypothetical protein [Streptomyces sp. NPDC056544]|uniref:hypothetical protein n=1 Tax=unclassified Streptomyces TaxID=2593676 RepID=UPI0036B9A7BD